MSELYKCAHPACPGLPYRASDIAHPCGDRKGAVLDANRYATQAVREAIRKLERCRDELHAVLDDKQDDDALSAIECIEIRVRSAARELRVAAKFLEEDL